MTMKTTVTMTIPDLTKSVTQMAVDAALEAASDWTNEEIRRLREELAPDPALADLFGTLRRILPGVNSDGSPLSDADLLARAIDKITTLQDEADLAAWRSIESDPPPQRADVLFYSGGCFWVGYAQEVSVHNSETGTEFMELNYFCDDDLMDGDPPTAWCPIPSTGEPEAWDGGEE